MKKLFLALAVLSMTATLAACAPAATEETVTPETPVVDTPVTPETSAVETPETPAVETPAE